MDKCKDEFGVDLDTLILISKAKGIWTIGRNETDPYWRYLYWNKVFLDLSSGRINYTDEGDEEYLSKPLIEYKLTWALNPKDFINDELHGKGAKTDKEWNNEKNR